MEIPKDLKLLPPLERPDVGEFAREIAKHLQGVRPAVAPGSTIVEVIPENVAKALIATATNVWRIRSRISDSSTHELKEEITKDDLRKLSRYVDSIIESFAGVGIEIKDRTGEAFDYGLPEKVVTAEPQAGLTKEIIVETIRPTIYWKNQIAQQGEVVIATPLETPKGNES
jgi:hypothetical protein